ncbi:hypothetical protein DVK02_01285 [Halobellus sp. Atlit-31R]|nr:hypothetical protein DVK02_01285 [Halobellus sp. Atlit-31R]
MSDEKRCPDCEEPLTEMRLQGSDAVGTPTIVSEEPTDGFLSSVRADEILTPVPYVCPDCRRTLFYAEE